MATKLRRAASGGPAWLGLRAGGAGLLGRVVVVSPHLDDGVLSLGAAIAQASRRGADVTVLTVLAGDPESRVPAGPWDERAGHRTAGQAARARRVEDLQACARLGARPVWLPYGDEQYGRGDDAALRAALAAELLRGETVLVPGYPLENPDHAWVTGTVLELALEARLGLYVEQPYASRHAGGPPTSVPAAAEVTWQAARAGLSDRLSKLRAARAYASQLPLLGSPLRHVFRYELARGGELVAWLRA